MRICVLGNPDGSTGPAGYCALADILARIFLR
jgi:hypothetical protein